MSQNQYDILHAEIARLERALKDAKQKARREMVRANQIGENNRRLRELVEEYQQEALDALWAKEEV